MLSQIRISNMDVQDAQDKLDMTTQSFADHLSCISCPSMFVAVGSDAVVSLSETERLPLWTELTDLVTRHKKYASAKWAMPPEAVSIISDIAERLAPKTPSLLHQRLFSNRDHDLYEEKGNYETQCKELEIRRQSAVMEIATSGGAQAVIDFATGVQSPWRVGLAFGSVATDDVDGFVLPCLFSTEQNNLAQFTGGYILGKYSSRGWLWVDQFDVSCWSPSDIGQLLAYLPFSSETWRRSSHLLGENELMYWSKANINPFARDADLEFAATQLLVHGRPYAAIRCLHGLQHSNKCFKSDIAVKALLAAVNSSEAPQTLDSYEIVELIKALQNDLTTNHDDLFRVEWAYLSLLARDEGASPVTLERRLANEPRFFCEVLRLIYRSKKDDRPREEPNEQKKNIASNAYRLLYEWKTPPGFRQDGIFSGELLVAWLAAVKNECSETGHLEVAMITVGHVLVYSPPDPNGLWIHCEAAKVLNEKDAENMRDGFRSELFNSRGVHGFTHGKEERSIAVSLREKADSVDIAGFHRLATTLKELASSYERDAERESTRDPFGD